MGSDTQKNSYSQEEIDLCRELLSKAKPYSQEEIDNLPFDSPDWVSDRMDAYTAQKILKELGLL